MSWQFLGQNRPTCFSLRKKNISSIQFEVGGLHQHNPRKLHIRGRGLNYLCIDMFTCMCINLGLQGIELYCVKCSSVIYRFVV